MDTDFLSHIIRDLFKNKDFTVIYGLNTNLRETLATSEHGLGAYALYTGESEKNKPDYSYYWEAGINHPFFTPGSCDLFISIDYDPSIINNYYSNVALQLVSLLKIHGLIFLINPGAWASELSNFFTLRNDLIIEAKRYKMLSNQKVYIYENI